MQTSDSQDDFTIKPFHTRTKLAHPQVSYFSSWKVAQNRKSGLFRHMNDARWKAGGVQLQITISVQLLFKTPDVHMIKTTQLHWQETHLQTWCIPLEYAFLPPYIHFMSTLNVVLPCATIFNDGSWTFTVVRQKNNFNQDSGLAVSPIWSSLL